MNELLSKEHIPEELVEKEPQTVSVDFIRNLEHDIRSSVSGIYGLSHYLLKQETDQNKKNYLTDVASCAKQLLEYTHELLDFTKMVKGQLPIKKEKLVLKQIVERVVALVKPACVYKNLTFQLEWDDALPDTLWLDNHRLSRLLLNLLNNAVKFTDKGYVRLTASKEHEACVFVIEDQGVGFPEDKKRYIDEPLSLIKASDPLLYRGIGVGLRVVKQFVEDLDGTMQLTTKTDGGSRFELRFPAQV